MTGMVDDGRKTGRVKCVIFDVYGTLLEAREGPEGGRENWRRMWPRLTGGMPLMPLEEFGTACQEVVVREHAERHAVGVRWPEVEWRSVVRRALPALRDLEESGLDALIDYHARQQRRTEAMPGALAFLAEVRGRGILTGVASNAQHYTFGEMEEAGIAVEGFERELCFWSFERGFSKPDPAVFAWLGDRLGARGILPEEVLMIGDRLDNDVEPALAAGWRAWHFRGAWPELSGGISPPRE